MKKILVKFKNGGEAEYTTDILALCFGDSDIEYVLDTDDGNIILDNQEKWFDIDYKKYIKSDYTIDIAKCFIDSINI